jgi:hypothetical protein
MIFTLHYHSRNKIEEISCERVRAKKYAASKLIALQYGILELKIASPGSL